MSKLARQMMGDKIAKLAKTAGFAGDEVLAACLYNLASVYLYGRDDLLKLVWASTKTTINIAEQEKEFRRGIAGPGAVEEDSVSQHLEMASQVAALHKEENLAAIISFTHSLRSAERDDLLQQLFDITHSLSNKAIGKKPEKEILMVDNDFEESP